MGGARNQRTAGGGVLLQKGLTFSFQQSQTTWRADTPLPQVCQSRLLQTLATARRAGSKSFFMATNNQQAKKLEVKRRRFPARTETFLRISTTYSLEKQIHKLLKNQQQTTARENGKCSVQSQ